jgi:molybdate-binding protein/DNA-binding XRE family transcriptional regulator
MIMSHTSPAGNRVRQRRTARGWSQLELAERAAISRTAVSAIEGDRLAPSVTTALSLARVLECTVEDLFDESASTQQGSAWAWPAAEFPARYWTADVGPRSLRYPTEPTADGELPHDGVASSESQLRPERASAPDTLVLAGCDPAAGLLARLYERTTRFRLLPLIRSSRAALDLLQRGLVHVAGVHLGTRAGPDNQDVVRRTLGAGYQLLRGADWEAGVAVAPGRSPGSIRSLVRGRTRWVARETGSGARQLLDHLFSRPRSFHRTADDHRSVAAALRCGWADAGVCLRFVSGESRLSFLSLGWEQYDLCYPASLADDPRIRALIEVVQSRDYRRLIGELPGYDARETGSLHG